MKDFKKYFRLNLGFFIQSVLIWLITVNYGIDGDLRHPIEGIFLWFVFVVMSYGILEQLEPKD